MPINNIPGVGPTNTDIATSVAAAVPTNASIAAAVAAPSAATIATSVAAAVPTLTQINNSVATNSSAPFGGTWVNVGLFNSNSVNGFTFSSLSGYRYYRLYLTVENLPAVSIQLRLNGDTGGNYNQFTSSSTGNTLLLKGNTAFWLQPAIGSTLGCVLDFPSANSTSVDKFITSANQNVMNDRTATHNAVWASTSAITSISVILSGSQVGNWYARLVGTN